VAGGLELVIGFHGFSGLGGFEQGNSSVLDGARNSFWVGFLLWWSVQDVFMGFGCGWTFAVLHQSCLLTATSSSLLVT
jgi:hypothetical protein